MKKMDADEDKYQSDAQFDFAMDCLMHKVWDRIYAENGIPIHQLHEEIQKHAIREDPDVKQLFDAYNLDSRQGEDEEAESGPFKLTDEQ